MSDKKFKLSDEVCMRLVQIFQEAILMNIDGADLLRQVEVTEGSDGKLILSAEYIESVNKMHEEWVNKAQREHEAAQSMSTTKIIFN